MIKSPLRILIKSYKEKKLWIALVSVVVIMSLNGCASQVKNVAAKAPVSDHAGNIQRSADELLIVDCLLPAEVIKLGGDNVYTVPRRPIRTAAWECKQKHGEYIPQDHRLLKIWIAEAQDCKPEAQTYVGDLYAQGLGTDQDYVRAAEWYRKAADQGYKHAQSRLGYLYEAGLGVEQNYEQAQRWYRLITGDSTSTRSEPLADGNDIGNGTDDQPGPQ